MNQIPVGVIGVGHLGSLHAKMFSDLPSVKFVGVTDIDSARAQQVASTYSTKAFSSDVELLENVRAVSIATPTAWLQASGMVAAFVPAMAIIGALVPVHRLLQQRPVSLLGER